MDLLLNLVFEEVHSLEVGFLRALGLRIRALLLLRHQLLLLFLRFVLCRGRVRGTRQGDLRLAGGARTVVASWSWRWSLG